MDGPKRTKLKMWNPIIGHIAYLLFNCKIEKLM